MIADVAHERHVRGHLIIYGMQKGQGVQNERMKKVTKSTYKKDKYYKSVCHAVNNLLANNTVITPVDIFIEIGNLTKENYENWRLGRIHYLEKVINCNLSAINRKLRILHFYALDLGLKPSNTVYRKWGKGRNRIVLRFSKSGNPALEQAYSCHYIASAEKNVNRPLYSVQNS